MASSTSPSDRRRPRLTVLLAAAALVTWVLAAAYMLYLDPEVRLNCAMAERRRAWARRCDAQFPHKVVAYGGSSCSFSIDGARLEERFGLPTVNLSMPATLGPNMLTQFALPACREGDTLVVALEAGLITRRFIPLMAATQLAYALGERQLLEDPAAPGWGWVHPSDLLRLRPEGARICAQVGKAILRRPVFRYRLEEVEPSGYQWTDIHDVPIGMPDQGPALSEDARRLFAFLKRWGEEHHVTVLYSLPWVFSTPPEVPGRRRENLALVWQIRVYLPVLHDPVLGPRVERDLFADTSHHLNRAGARLRTDALGEQLTKNDLWNDASLAAVERELDSVR